jgi:hypothetical protein
MDPHPQPPRTRGGIVKNGPEMGRFCALRGGKAEHCPSPANELRADDQEVGACADFSIIAVNFNSQRSLQMDTGTW